MIEPIIAIRSRHKNDAGNSRYHVDCFPDRKVQYFTAKKQRLQKKLKNLQKKETGDS